ncbi:hypothetical protein Stuart_38 [Providencia phage vB_PstP_PS3]|uniref:Uncharacterized protein n=1 Tax=Providencia phage vB_PstP_PS3 TaxID=2848038 RepID=A0A411AWE9_9CAUD|nr:hypothetical protein HOV05_gp38 [Providencia phage vB_PstP_PS3]QAX92433.1 hypothetical protein Stuart_38 [Providencia phage vB_PstP_PS3]
MAVLKQFTSEHYNAKKEHLQAKIDAAQGVKAAEKVPTKAKAKAKAKE